MIFVSSSIRYDLPHDLADHLAKHWGEATPFEPNIAVIESIEDGAVTYTKHEGAGNWFLHNLPPKVLD